MELIGQSTRKIYVLLPVHNRREITQSFVRCLRSQTHQNYHLVLIDDGSTDGTEEMVRDQIESLTVLRGEGRWWWAGSLQQGYSWLKGGAIDPDDVVLIMNDDTQFEDDFLEKGLSVLMKHDRTLLLARSHSLSSGRLLDQGVHAEWRSMSFRQAEKPEDINCLSTMGLFMRVRDMVEVGGFHPGLLPHFASDYEFTMRAHRKGFKLLTDSSVSLRLREETTWNRDIGQEPLISFLKTLFAKKSAYNPLVWTCFIALACPLRWKILNWCKVWAGATVVVLKRLLGPVRLPGSTHTVDRSTDR
jgi:GT2 family glycosyltransferase